MLLYRVFPHLPRAKPGEPGHPLYVHPLQGKGRWDNPALYLARYLAASAEAAVGEAFANLSTWSPAMLAAPFPAGSVRRLGTYRIDETANPLLDLDDAQALLDRHLRPTDIVVRNRPRTQSIAGAVFAEGHWAGISWWSYHRPQWTLLTLWSTVHIADERVEDIDGHPALTDAAKVLAKHVDWR